MADPTDRSSMDDLTDAVASKMRTGGWWWAERPASEALDAIRSVLRERDLLLGPDGLLRADEQRWASGMFASFMRTGDEEDDAPDMLLFTLSPLDPPEDT